MKRIVNIYIAALIIVIFSSVETLTIVEFGTTKMISIATENSQAAVSALFYSISKHNPHKLPA